MTARKLVSAALVATTLWGCAGESPKLTAPPETYGTIDAKGKSVSVKFEPKVDILFVIDHSKSMKVHQENLSQNIDRFVEGFASNKLIDFQIGVTSVFDSQTYTPDGPVTDYKPNGLLWPLKAPADMLNLIEGQPPFVSRLPDNKHIPILKESLKIGVLDYKDEKTGEYLGGPLEEETFSPVIQAFSKEMLNKNRGFYRRDAHLVIVMITDANDASPVSASQLEQFLRKLKGNDVRGERFSTIAVIPPVEGATCNRDPSGAAHKIVEFLNLTGGTQLNMCAEYGDDLAKIGEVIKQRVLDNNRKVIPLDAIPEFDPQKEMIQVFYGDKKLEPGQGWTYDDYRVAIVINGDFGVEYQEGAEIRIQATSVNTNGLGLRAHPLVQPRPQREDKDKD